jgi:hypothetical protein
MAGGTSSGADVWKHMAIDFISDNTMVGRDMPSLSPRVWLPHQWRNIPLQARSERVPERSEAKDWCSASQEEHHQIPLA